MSKHDKSKGHAQAEVAAAHAHDDDFIVAPKGMSRRQVLFTMGLMVFVLLIFTVGDLFQTGVGGMFGGGGKNPVYLSWTDPVTKLPHEVRYDVFIKRQRALDRLARVGAFRPLHTPEDKKRPRVTPEDAALYLILEQLAVEQGIEVSTPEFTNYLLSRFQTGESVAFAARQVGLSVPAFEQDLREMLRVDKLMQLMRLGVGQLGQAAGAVDPARVEELWVARHPEYSFQTVEVSGEDYEEAAMAEVPPDEELESWFHALPIWRQQKHYTEDRFVPKVAWLPTDGSFDATALLAEFPAPEGLDPESQAASYYERFHPVRFRNEVEEEDGDGSEGDDENAENAEDEGDESEDEQTADEQDAAAATDEDPPPLYEPYEDVAEQCRVEAPIHSALGGWHARMREIMDAPPPEGGGPVLEVDFQAEAEGFGLTFVALDEPLTKAQIEEMESWGGKFVANQFSFAREGALLPSVVVEEDAMIVAYLEKKEPRAEPPFADIRDAIAEEWAKEKAVDIAVAKLEEIRDVFGERPEEPDPPVVPDVPEDEREGVDPTPNDPTSLGGSGQTAPNPWRPTATAEAFRTAAEALDLEVVERPWLERYAVPNDDFDAMTEVDKHIRVSKELFELEADEVAPAMSNAAKTHGFLIRYVGERTKPFDEVTAKELFQLRRDAAGDTARGMEEKVFRVNSDWFKARFLVDFYEWNRPQEAPEEAPASEQP